MGRIVAEVQAVSTLLSCEPTSLVRKFTWGEVAASQR